MITTKQLHRIRELSGGGLTDVEIGISDGQAVRWRKKMGLPAAGLHRHKRTVHYTVYDSGTDEVLATGTAVEITQQMGWSPNSTYSIICKALKGRYKKYVVVKEGIRWWITSTHWLIVCGRTANRWSPTSWMRILRMRVRRRQMRWKSYKPSWSA